MSLGALGLTFAQTDKEKPKGSLADAIVGTWQEKRGNGGQDKITFTFNKDNSFIMKEPESAAQKGTYSIIDAETVEVKAPNRPTLKLKIKIAGDTMQMTNGDRRPLALKRVK
jgi:hypothetical protein